MIVDGKEYYVPVWDYIGSCMNMGPDSGTHVQKGIKVYFRWYTALSY